MEQLRIGTVTVTRHDESTREVVTELYNTITGRAVELVDTSAVLGNDRVYFVRNVSPDGTDRERVFENAEAATSAALKAIVR